MTFVLQSDKDGRVILDKRLHMNNVRIRDIEAPSWKEARASISEYEFNKVDGYGWFVS